MPPAVEPVTFQSRAGISEEPVYEQSWMGVPFDDYEGMTQQQFQDSVSPFNVHGKLVPIEVPKGWRRVESGRPGKHFYVHMSTGTISRYPKEQYDCKQECWVSKDGVQLSQEELALDPERRALQLANPRAVDDALAGLGAPAPSAPSAAPSAPSAASGATPPWLEPPKGEAPLPVGLLFPGQGSQYVKMLSTVKDLPAVKEMLATAERILGYDILDICLNGPEEKLEQTRYCQPAMYIGGMAAIEKLKAEKPDRVSRCKALAGLSLGEYTALTVAGVFTFEQGLRIVKLRGEAMQQAAEASAQSMLSVAGLSEDVLARLCKESCAGPQDVCQIANFLFPNGFACAGSTSAVETLMQKATDTDGCLQAKLLKTSGGFHTPLMSAAREKLLAALREVEQDMKPPRCDVYMNLTGERLPAGAPPGQIIDMLGDQLVKCVRWEPSMRRMLEDGVSEFYECGPMKQLKAMMKRISAEAHKNTSSVDV